MKQYIIQEWTHCCYWLGWGEETRWYEGKHCARNKKCVLWALQKHLPKRHFLSI